MIRRIELSDAAVPRWRIPDLDPAGELAVDPSAVDPSRDPVEVTPPPEHAAEAEPAIDNAVEAAIARGYAEGFARGQAESSEKGYAEGFASGSRAAQEPLAAQTQRLASIIVGLGSPIPALERAIEEALLGLALEVARCVIGSEISQSRTHLARLVREALSKVPIEMPAVRVLLNPADMELVRSLAPDLENGGALLVADATIEAGGCRILAQAEKPVKDRRWRPRLSDGMSEVDLTLATRWRNVMLTLFDSDDK